MNYPSKRPPENERRFTSAAVENAIHTVSADIADPELRWLFENCLPNTLDTTIHYDDTNGPDTFLITGDIDAMWLRDSAAQMWPYLRFINDDAKLQTLFIGLIRRQAKCVRLDPYANAFCREPVLGEWQSDQTEMKPGVHERKWELDSLCYFLRLSFGYYETTGDLSAFDDEWIHAVELIFQTLEDQQQGRGYTFQRKTLLAFETRYHHGDGPPGNPCGLVQSGFRPSDDACLLPFHIPGNCFAAVVLKQTAALCEKLEAAELTEKFLRLSDQIDAAIRKHGLCPHPNGTEALAYETDGFGGHVFMDDANIPSLLSLPYLGWCAPDDPLYLNTRAVVLSEANPYFFSGNAGKGTGGPHIGPNYIWPMSIIMRALTATDDEEILQCLRALKSTHAGTGFMHESFHKNDPADFTREWFSWVNSLFGELILTLWETRKNLLREALK